MKITTRTVVPQKQPPLMPDNFRISPEERICPSYDYQSIAAYRVASRDTMGFRVIDDCVREHIM